MLDVCLGLGLDFFINSVAVVGGGGNMLIHFPTSKLKH